MNETPARHPSGHMWLDGALVPAERATVSVLDPGFLHGESVFELIRAYEGRLFRAAAHLKRLEQSARSFGLSVPHEPAALVQAMRETLVANDLTDTNLRLTAWRTASETTSFTIFPRPVDHPPDDMRERGASAIAIHTERALGRFPVGLKTGNYLELILARRRAQAADAFEAVLVNRVGELLEGTLSNVFLVVDGGVVTPPVEVGLLAGVTRQAVLDAAATSEIPAEMRRVPLAERYTASEAFLTNTSWEILPLREMEGASFPAPGPVTERLQAAFESLRTLELEAVAPAARRNPDETNLSSYVDRARNSGSGHRSS